MLPKKRKRGKLGGDTAPPVSRMQPADDGKKVLSTTMDRGETTLFSPLRMLPNTDAPPRRRK